MKTIFIIPMLFISFISCSQTQRSIELVELIKLFATDSAGVTHFPELQSYVNKQHYINVLINGKVVEPDEMLFIDKIHWIANLNTTKTIYSIQAMGFQFSDVENPINDLFGKSNITATELKSCTNPDDQAQWTRYYLLSMNGKRKLWMRIDSSATYGPYMPILDIILYSNEAEFKMDCPY